MAVELAFGLFDCDIAYSISYLVARQVPSYEHSQSVVWVHQVPNGGVVDHVILLLLSRLDFICENLKLLHTVDQSFVCVGDS